MPAQSRPKSTQPATAAKATAPGLESPQPELAPESNLQALGVLGLGGAAAAMGFSGPEGLSGEIAAMDPSLLSVMLDALPQELLLSALPPVLHLPGVRAWLAEQAPELIARIPGAAEALTEGLIPVGHAWTLAHIVEGSVKQWTGECTRSLELSRRGPEAWGLSIGMDVAVGVGKDRKLAQGEVGGLVGGPGESGLHAKGEASAMIKLEVQADFGAQVPVEELVALVLQHSDSAEVLGSIVDSGLLSGNLEGFETTQGSEAKVEGALGLGAVQQFSPKLGAQLAGVDASAELGFETGMTSRWTEERGSETVFHIGLGGDASASAALSGLIPVAGLLHKIAVEAGTEVDVVVKYPDIRIDTRTVRELGGLVVERSFDSVDAFLAAFDQKSAEPLETRWMGLVGGGLELTYREDLQPGAVEAVASRLKGLDGTKLGADGSIQLEQTVWAAATPMPEALAGSVFLGSDLELVRAVAEIARGGADIRLGLSQSEALELLELDELRLVGSTTGKLGLSADVGEAELGTALKVTHSFDLPYDGPERIF